MSQNLHSIIAEPLVRTTVHGLPGTPALLALARFRYAPRAKFGPAAGPGPVAFVVESGSLVFSAQGQVSVRRAGSATTESPPSDTEFTVQNGDQVLIPGGVVHAVLNAGPAPATILGAATFPGSGPPKSFPDGVSFVPLVMNTVTTLAGSPAEYSLDRVTLAPDSREADTFYSGPGLHYVESGTLDVQVISGEARLTSGTAGGAVQTIGAGQQIQVARGQGIVVPSGSIATIGNTAPHAAVVLSLRTRAAFGVAPAVAAIEPTEVLKSFVQTVMDGAKPEAAKDFLAPGFFSHDQPPALQDKDADVGAFLARVIFPAFSSFQTTFPKLIQEGDLVAGHWIQTFKHSGDGYFGSKATGRAVRIDGFTIARVKEGRLVEHFEERDIPSWHRTIGLGFPLGSLEGSSQSLLSADTDKKVINDYFGAWRSGNRVFMTQTMTSDFVNTTLLPGQQSGSAGMVQLMTALRNALDGFQVTIDLLIADGAGTVFSRVRFSGVHKASLFGVAATGKALEISAIDRFTVRNGQIAERAGLLDEATLAIQLGKLQPGLPEG
jgi:steroid delta-isomerase-like uncharacterized protein